MAEEPGARGDAVPVRGARGMNAPAAGIQTRRVADATAGESPD